MHVEYAQLPSPEDSADRIFITDNAVIVLDGATAFVPVSASAQTYADHLGHRLGDQLHANPHIDLREALAIAIYQTAANLGLRSGASPSSTVSILREGVDEYDVLVLGDTTVVWGAGNNRWSLSDNRLDHVASAQRKSYQDRLRSGHGFDHHHQELLRSLQKTQRLYRNIEGGYWIAEADPRAASNALVTTVPRRQLAWSIISTDGAYELLVHHGCKDWANIATFSSAELDLLLRRLYTWEDQMDPTAIDYPRAKRHDDKTVVAILPTDCLSVT